MDFVEGKSLAEIVRNGPLTARTVANYVKQIADAIQYAHQHGTLHRDLKPSNVLIDTDGKVRITDFGLAKRLDRGTDLTVTGSVLGTPAYMSPEQAAGRRGDIGVASDVYSLGAVLYELLTGRPPYHGATPFDTVLQILESDPIPPRSLNPAIPADVATICLKCIERHSQRRYPSAAALANDLDRFLNQQPILARPASSMRKLWGISKRRPWLFTALATTIGMLLLGVAYWLWAENAFLRYKAEHPEYVRKPGIIEKEVRQLFKYGSWVCILGSNCLVFFASWFRRRRRRHRPVPIAILLAYGTVGVAFILFVIYTCARSIDAAVWEGHTWPGGQFWWVEYLSVCLPYVACLAAAWLGMSMVIQAVREYEISAFGTIDESTLLPEQLETARSLILDKKIVEAVKYCKQVSSSKSAGLEMYHNLKHALVEEYPDKFPELTLTGFIKTWLLRSALFSFLIVGGMILAIYIISRFL